MISLLQPPSQTFPNHLSPHEDLLGVLPRFPEFHQGGGFHSATYLRSAVPPLHRYIVYLDRLQDRFPSHSASFSLSDTHSRRALNGL